MATLCPYHDGKYCGYSQETVDALRKERDKYRAALARIARNSPTTTDSPVHIANEALDGAIFGFAGESDK